VCVLEGIGFGPLGGGWSGQSAAEAFLGAPRVREPERRASYRARVRRSIAGPRTPSPRKKPRSHGTSSTRRPILGAAVGGARRAGASELGPGRRAGPPDFRSADRDAPGAALLSAG